ncbi:InlB B-repeat-containing protein [Bombiscardovia apis]|uniref:RCC1 domain-containing protein n=1 Tax=Bombiscardovia apis TaxID=2932182 RepID=UPI002954D8AF|nr:InlB B-repeat-containing protein [Bombiscardovia apis]
MSWGGGSASLARPILAHADSADLGFSLDPDHGPVAGGNEVAIKPPFQTSIKFKKISSGSTHILAIGDDDNTWAWGSNDPTLLGSDTPIVGSVLPVKVKTPAGVRFTEVSAGWYHNLAIGSDNRIYAWGKNTQGQLGNGSTIDSSTPQLVNLSAPAGVRFVSIIASGYCTSSYALDSEGNVYAWGNNRWGQLGVGDYNWYPSPTPLNNPVKFTSLSCSGEHCLAIGTDSRTYSWGWNNYGQLGDGSTTNNPSPTPFNTPTQFTSVSAGGQADWGYAGGNFIEGYSLALDQLGNLYTWGFNNVGQLGNGTTTNRSTPQQVSTPVPFTRISAGSYFALALGNNGKAYAWGSNSSYDNQYSSAGILGDGTTTDRYRPTLVASPAGVEFADVSAGWIHSKGLTAEGKVYSWGPNQYGQLGDGTTTWRTTPVPVAKPNIVVTAVRFDALATGTPRHDTAEDLWYVIAPGHPAGTVNVYVDWTLNGAPQTRATLKYTYRTSYTVHFDMAGAPGTAPADQHPLSSNDETITWPNPMPTWSHHWFDGWFTTDGKPWDFNDTVSSSMTLTAKWEEWKFTLDPDRGPTTGGNTVAITPPLAPQGISFSRISSGSKHTLAIGSDGNTYAWGSNEYGQLGDDSSSNQNLPVRVLAPANVHFLQVSAGSEFSAALGSDGNIYTWGRNSAGQLGNGTLTNQPTPRRIAQGVLPVGKRYTQVSVGDSHVLALANTNRIYTWGQNAEGQLGDGTQINRRLPVQVQLGPQIDGVTFTSISAGDNHSLAIGKDNNTYAWGRNVEGQLGIGTNSSLEKSPVKTQSGALPAGAHFTQISAGGRYSLAVDNNNNLYAWGDNQSSQLGDGTTVGKNAPTQVNPGVIPSGVSFTHISAGDKHSLVIDSNGDAYTWGSNDNGQLGDNTSGSNRSTPVKVQQGTLPTGVRLNQISAGSTQSTAIGSDGHAYTWGGNGYGQLGSGSNGAGNPPDTTADQHEPVQVGLQKLVVTGVKFDQTEATPAPVWNAAKGVWIVKAPAHEAQLVTANIHWILGSQAQDDYPLPYTYEFLLPIAGAIPLQRLTGGSMLCLTLLAALVYAGYQLARQRKSKSSLDSKVPQEPERV